MKTEEFNNALEYLDYDLVDEYVREKESVQKMKVRRKAIATLVPIAACFVILLSIGTAFLGYNLGFSKPNGNNKGDELQIFFEKEGIFVFEYEGRMYQAFVTPMFSDGGIDFTESESVSIRDVGDLISTVNVTDKNGNTATMEIYSGKGNFAQDSILLKLDSGYFVAKGIDKSVN